MLAASLAVLALSACSGGERQVAGPSGDPGPGSPFTSLTVTTLVAEQDAELAETLGWTAGVPGAEVHLNRNGTASWTVLATDASGRARFDRLLGGLYRVYAGRRLTAAEAQDAAEPIRAFGDGRTIEVGGGAGSSVELELLADRPRGLVISEIGHWTPPPWEVAGGSYLVGVYFEVYNNSDRSLPLDGLLFGLHYPFGAQDDHTPCAESQVVRDDSTALYGRWFLQFPGSGSEHPILPGEAKLVAWQAIDHTPIHPELLDLRGADFEVAPEAGADNPAVPNMREVGLAPFVPHWMLAVRFTYFLSTPLDPRALPIAFRDRNGRDYVRVPRAAVLDAATSFALWPDQDRDHPPCIPMVHPVFDRYEGGLFEIGPGVEQGTNSLQRIFLRSGPGGGVLQNTNTSAVDFALAPRTPGWVP